MKMEVVFRRPKLLRALTSLGPQEFARLEEALEAPLASERLERTHNGAKRQRAYGARNLGRLPATREKLLFILFCFKAYPVQTVMGVFFDLSQPQVCLWVKKLTPLLTRVPGAEWLLPARQPADLERVLAETPELLLILDGAERPIRRPKDKQAWKDDYSGKKKARRKKNLLAATGGKRVVYLGPASPGSVHDKKLAGESGLRFPPGSMVCKDTGFQGHVPPGVISYAPTKKPRGRELLPAQKKRNALISRYRAGAKHVIAGVKRCRIVLDTFRSWRAGFVDAVVEVASGLHNLRVTTRGCTLAS